MFVAERFISDIVEEYGRTSCFNRWWYMVSTSMQVFETETSSFILSYEKSIIERTMQYIKDRTECFDDYFPCRKRKCKLKHVKKWLNLFADYYNKEIIS